MGTTVTPNALWSEDVGAASDLADAVLRRIFSNANRGFVFEAFDKTAASAPSAMLATLYFWDADRVLAAAAGGRQIRLIDGLNTSTSSWPCVTGWKPV